ncbi:hypothetical protein ACKGJO_08180 [Gracilimonas sp. Q87]|uniref:hypothetical protein n=1 Tax=Gracilimonas sp. Q87 TaxID=3384766 RepID=UPI0039845722
MKRAKIKAVEDEISLKELIIRALENEIGKVKEKNDAPWEDLKGKGTTGALRPNDSGFKNQNSK